MIDDVVRFLILYFFLSTLLFFDGARPAKLLVAISVTLYLRTIVSDEHISVWSCIHTLVGGLGSVLMIHVIACATDCVEAVRGQSLSAQYDPLLHLEESSLAQLTRYIVIAGFITQGGIEQVISLLHTPLEQGATFASIVFVLLQQLIHPIVLVIPWCAAMIAIDYLCALCGSYAKISSPTGCALMIKAMVAFFWLLQSPFLSGVLRVL